MASSVNVRFSAEDRRQQILETAMDLFGRQGYLGTTTRQIAEVAGVNEAIIFRHFPTKDDLYWEVLDRKIRDGQGSARMVAQLNSGREARDVFVAIGRDFLERRTQDPAPIRMMLFTALENHKLSSRFFHTHIADAYELLADYIRGEIGAGRFRDVDPLLAAKGFFGMFVYHFMVQELFEGRKYRNNEIEEVSETLTDIWLRGMVAEAEDQSLAGVARNRATPIDQAARAKHATKNFWGPSAVEPRHTSTGAKDKAAGGARHGGANSNRTKKRIHPAGHATSAPENGTK
jgi:AcrR family transcriptional regulator